MKILTTAEMKEVDRLTTERYGVPGLTLMENAGESVAEFIQERFANLERREIVVLCGKGNNGGDGFVVARQLLGMGAKPKVYLFADPGEMRGEAGVSLGRWPDASGELHVVLGANKMPAAKAALASADIIVDALLGTGARGPVEGLLREAIEAVNRQDSAEHRWSRWTFRRACPRIRASRWARRWRRITRSRSRRRRWGCSSGAAKRMWGELVVREIGSPPELIEEVGKGNMRWSEPREFAKFAMRAQAARATRATTATR